MTLFDFQFNLSLLLPLIERGVVALERIAGPIPTPTPTPRMSTLDDYSYIPPDEISRATAEAETIARASMVIPGSEAYIQGVEEYERQIIAGYGDEMGGKLIAQLPWKVRKMDPVTNKPVQE